MHESILDTDYENQLGYFSIYNELVLQFRVSNDIALSADPQCVAVTRNEEEKSNFGISEQVLERVQPSVPEPIRNREGLFVQHRDKASRVALGREGEYSILAARSDDNKGARRNKAATNIVDPIDVLHGRPRSSRPFHLAQTLAGRNYFFEAPLHGGLLHRFRVRAVQCRP